ncbi:MAG: putative lipid II flippase FtsW [Acidimicrobiales bacterium]
MLLAAVVVLSLIGLVMVLSASSVESLRHYGSPWHFFERQLVWLVVGSAGLAIAIRVDHRAWRRLAPLGMAATVVLLVAVLVPGVGVRASGASRWLGNASLQIQPSELAKLALVFFAADVIDRRSARPQWRYQLMPVLLVVGVLVVLVMKQPDMGTTMVLVCIALAMVFTAGLPWKPLLGVLGLAGGAGLVMAMAAPYRWRRLTAFIHPQSDAGDSGYQSVQALAFLSHGRLIGDGIGSSIGSSGYLPNAKTDFIFAVVGEETGLVGGVLLAGLFLALGLIGTRIACRATSTYSALVAAGITAWLVSQAIINIGAVVGLLPVTGVPLPFVSFGGTSLVIAMFGAGVLTNIAVKG